MKFKFYTTGQLQAVLIVASCLSSAQAASENTQDEDYAPNQKAGEYLKNQAVGKVNAGLDSFLGQYGTADIQLNIDDKAHLDGSSLDLLLPLMNKKNDFIFTQWGWRNKDDRNTLNWGVGYRHFFDDWMLGGNLFLDNDITGDNRRIGVGGEAWRDYLKFSINGYLGTTDWNDSVDLNDHKEKSADGYDIRMEAFMPWYPQIGGTLSYEKYYGDNVALFGSDDLQKDPYAFTLGLTYSPVPVLNFSVNQKMGSHQANDTQIKINMNYRLGVPLSRQWDPDEVETTRKLHFSRYDLVNRNYNVVLKYKNAQYIKISLPGEIKGYAGDTASLTANVTSKYAVDRVDWDTAAFVAAGGQYRKTSPYAIEITYPPYKPGETNQYSITATAYDVKGNKSEPESTSVTVLYSDDPAMSELLTVVSDNAAADGVAKNVVQATVKDASGNPVKGQSVAFSATNGAVISPSSALTDDDGKAIAALTNSTSGESDVMAKFSDGVTQTVKTTFIGETSISMATIRDGAVSDGVDTDAVEATVTDDKGTPVPGVEVTFSTDDWLATLGQKMVKTDANGKARTTVSEPSYGAVTVTGTIAGGAESSTTVNFYRVTTKLEKLSNNVPADGASEYQLKVTMTKKDGSPANGQIITSSVYGAPAGVVLLTPQAATDANGVAIIKATSTSPGKFALLASSPAAGSLTTPMNFR